MFFSLHMFCAVVFGGIGSVQFICCTFLFHLAIHLGFWGTKGFNGHAYIEGMVDFVAQILYHAVKYFLRDKFRI